MAISCCVPPLPYTNRSHIRNSRNQTMKVDSQQVIKAMLDSAWIKDHELAGGHSSPGHVLTISRQCGSYGEEIAQLCAERLNVSYFDKKLIEEVAKSAGVEPEVFHQLEKKVSSMKPNWLETAFTNRPWLEAKYSRNLVSVLLGIRSIGGVVLGRGANYILGHSACLRIRIVAPLNIRAKRFAARAQVEKEEARRQVLEIDDERENFMKTLYHKKINHPEDYDLTINTERISIETAVELIMDSWHARHSCSNETTP
ncbi:MAG TPA: cytidylate kinase-like family protein [Chromatiales bacterium]|nr:cytidylate kinase-like family protein [Thiotrichales bacterium]HIP69159.1 cytidylate kinase-like family protein [Chromatiales bacterium]